MTTATIGSTNNLVSGALSLTPVPGTQVYWWVQNQDTVPLTCTISQLGDQSSATIILNPGIAAGYAGGFIDNYQMGFEGGETIALSSTKATHQFGSGGSRLPYIQINRNG